MNVRERCKLYFIRQYAYNGRGMLLNASCDFRRYTKTWEKARAFDDIFYKKIYKQKSYNTKLIVYWCHDTTVRIWKSYTISRPLLLTRWISRGFFFWRENINFSPINVFHTHRRRLQWNIIEPTQFKIY